MEIAKFVLEHSENEMTVIVARRKRKIKIEMFLFKERERGDRIWEEDREHLF